MRPLHIKRVIQYEWWRDTGRPIAQNHLRLLDESAWEFIFSMLKEGYTEGPLVECLGHTDVTYSGSWSITEEGDEA